MSEFLQDLLIAAWLGPPPKGGWSETEWQENRIAIFFGFFRGRS